jgi:hypothetical protein
MGPRRTNTAQRSREFHLSAIGGCAEVVLLKARHVVGREFPTDVCIDQIIFGGFDPVQEHRFRKVFFFN